MGIAKNYLRYVHESTFGLTAASQAGAAIQFLKLRNTEDRYVAVSANENIFFWDLKTKQIINRLTYDLDSAAEVTTFECHSPTNIIAVGYANGHIRIFDFETGSLKITFTGHRTAITALAFDSNGSRLASGGKDCNIVIWDISGEKGMFALKGHKNSISKLAFLFNQESQKDCIVSSSIDAVSTIKIWDLQIQHCFHTIPGQSSGVWSFIILKNGTRLVVGSTSPELKVYSISFSDEIEVKHVGNILRNSNSISGRIQNIVVDPEETLMICHSVDKNIEVYGLRSPEEALSYAKKQAKKAARKEAKRKNMDQDPEPSSVSLDALSPQSTVECEFNRKFGSYRLQNKVKALAVANIQSKSNSRRYRIAATLSSNLIESLVFHPENNEKDQELLKHQLSIENLSHRSDVRSVSISSDNTLIMTASAESAKVWRLESGSCTATIETEYTNCCTFANAQNLASSIYDNRFALVGTKSGHIQIIDIGNVEVTQTVIVSNEGKPINSIFVLPSCTGIVCGCEDGLVKFYNYVWKDTLEDGRKQTCLSLEEDRALTFQEGVTCVAVSSNNNLLAIALLDSTVRIHFVDTFKYFLTMYGHKFPVTTLDISDDNTLLVTGSPDKNIKIWGLDFGDCHKSIFAHDDAVTCVKFVPRTHHIFSSGRDKLIKQWDCDRFIKIQTLRGHQAEIWCLSVSPNGKFVVTGSHDKSIRIFRRTEEILVPSEEDETERELEDERNVFEKQENIVVGEANFEIGFATKMTIDTVKSTDKLIEAIDVFGNEQEKDKEYKKQCEIADSKGEPRPQEPEHDPLLITMMTSDYQRYMLEILRRIRSSELEQILVTLPFDYVRKLLIVLVIFLEKNWDVELVVRCSVFLLKVNFGQIAASPMLVPVLTKLHAIILQRSSHMRDCAGFNLMALEHLSQNRKHQDTKVSRDLPISLY